MIEQNDCKVKDTVVVKDRSIKFNSELLFRIFNETAKELKKQPVER